MCRKRHLSLGNPMTRRVLVAIGATLLTIGGSGIIAALVWITADKVNGNLSYTYNPHAEALIFLLPILLLTMAIVGAIFLTTALATSPKDARSMARTMRNLHPHTGSHA